MKKLRDDSGEIVTEEGDVAGLAASYFETLGREEWVDSEDSEEIRDGECTAKQLDTVVVAELDRVPMSSRWLVRLLP